MLFVENNVTLYNNNCITRMKTLQSNSVRCIYHDPPFFTNTDFKTEKDGVIFGFKDSIYGKYLIEYIETLMKPVIIESHRILDNEGTFYLHCDYHAMAYLQIVCDEIFGHPSLNQICWIRTTSKGTSKNKFGVIHDTILVYTKSDNYIFNIQKEQSKDNSNQYNKSDKKGNYRLVNIIQSGVMAKNSKGTSRFFPTENKTIQLDKDHGWKWTQNHINEFVQNDGEFEWSSGNLPNYKKYLDDGQSCTDVWDQLYLHPSSNEKNNYPTQKPEALLERIILTSTNKDDTVLDGFMGSGTTIAVALRLGRKVIGIDESSKACLYTAKRINYPNISIIGLRIPLEQRLEEAKGTIRDIQDWVCDIYNFEYGKGTRDKLIDGLGYYNGNPVVLQSKSCEANQDDIRTLIYAMDHYHDTKYGYYVALKFSRDFMEDVERLRKKGYILTLHTLEEANKKYNEKLDIEEQSINKMQLQNEIVIEHKITIFEKLGVIEQPKMKKHRSKRKSIETNKKTITFDNLIKIIKK